jgi:hypothetical protein
MSSTKRFQSTLKQRSPFDPGESSALLSKCDDNMENKEQDPDDELIDKTADDLVTPKQKKKKMQGKVKSSDHSIAGNASPGTWRSGGVRGRRLKRLTHPLERSVAGFFVITLFFTLLAIVSGVPFVLILCLLLPVGLAGRALFNCECLRTRRLDERKCTPIECFWLRAGMRNNCKRARALCLLYVDDGLTLPQLRDLVMSRLIQRPGMERFRWVLRHKGESL